MITRTCARCVAGALLAGLGARAADAQDDAVRRSNGDPRPNLVLIVLDDFGVDRLGAFGQGNDGDPPPCTPNLDALAREGILFRRVWTDPLCSPSRAQLLTGRHGFRTGIGKGIDAAADRSLRVELEDMLPRMLAGYDSSAVGKWHLLSLADGDANHPLDAGFGYYAGSLFNLTAPVPEAEACRGRSALNYSNWLKTFDVAGNGALGSRCSAQYATTDTADEAVLRARLMRPPWFLYVAFNAPHWPVHDPPKHLCPRDADCPRIYCAGDKKTRTPELRVRAMVEALDTEIGRLLSEVRALHPNTLFFVIGDNGSDDMSAAPDDAQEPKRGKATLFEGGIHVPLIAAGPGVVAGECDALVSSTDIYATLTELAGAPAAAEDSVSFVPYLRGERAPLRKTVYAEGFFPNQPHEALAQGFTPTNHTRALRDERYKLIRATTPEGTVESLFDLDLDPLERNDLLLRDADHAPDLSAEARERCLALRAELDEIEAR